MSYGTLQPTLLLQALNEGKIPKYLYKYRDAKSNTESIFKSKKIWFSLSTAFNDPFDCHLSEAQHSLDDANKFREHILEGRPDRDFLMSQPVSIERLEAALEGSKQLKLSRLGILCLSRNYNNILMWSHYADYHKGLVIEFDLEKDLDFFVTPIKIKYVEGYEPTNYFINQKEAIDKIISTKSLHWSYEEEIRILKNNHVGACAVSPAAIKRIIFGCKSDPDFKERIKILCGSAGLGHVTFSSMKMSYGKFSLECVDE
ncbi:DUF2971 domain-containing protein [Stagnimonas aquatica]|uniref:DUF2971 domain-containing protein n=1 Tax=Stagnimonas aquatica TaxID=2689987 RepID=A0A3N0UYI2_9GAMM|nr:DUF2971 domain-containing protein [Stagnimonas aquatica]ROH85616.1 DUF2971 domain-containing protein [Stagnimonas aquatica]